MDEPALTLSDEQLDILEKEHNLHVNGQSRSYNRAEAAAIIKGERTF